ncbi:Transmembrane protein 50A [Chytriomyces hyalinus]|nr:Transmembrane protein 50A [Chytriomyces hyalinus]
MAKGRYTPLASTQPPAAAAPSNQAPASTVSAASTYIPQQPLDARPTSVPTGNYAQPISTGTQQRYRPAQSPFICSALFTACFARVAKLFPSRTMAVGYSSGMLVIRPTLFTLDSILNVFAMGWWLFIDGVVYASTRNKDELPAVRFEDWLPGILSTLSLIIVNLIDKDSLNADDFSYSGSNVACKARACAFIGITMAMGALGGSFVSIAA